MSNITKEGKIAAEFWTYIDDIRSIELSEEEGWVVVRQIFTYCIYLVIQDSTQKRKLLSKTPKTWAGSKIKTNVIGCSLVLMGVVPAPDGTIYLVDINGTCYWGSFRVHVLGSKTIF